MTRLLQNDSNKGTSSSSSGIDGSKLLLLEDTTNTATTSIAVDDADGRGEQRLKKIIKKLMEELLDEEQQQQDKTPEEENDNSTNEKKNLCSKIFRPWASSTSKMDQDSFSMMMICENVFSHTWTVGISTFLIQIILGGLVALDQPKKEFGSTSLFNIPVQASWQLTTAQFFTAIVALLSQTDVLHSITVVNALHKNEGQLLLKVRKLTRIKKAQQEVDVNKDTRDSRGNVDIKDEGDNRGNIELVLASSPFDAKEKINCTQVYHIWIPNILKFLEGLLILIVSWIIIIQSENIVDLLKDFSALFVISTIDNVVFLFARQKYLGEELFEIADRVESSEIVDGKKYSRWIPSVVFIFTLALFLVFWGDVVNKQKNGHYFNNKYPLCHLSDGKKGRVQDTICDIELNTRECGWDGGDCTKFNERYPNCTVPIPSLLGDRFCNEQGEYNTFVCGYDDGDCLESNIKKLDNSEDFKKFTARFQKCEKAPINQHPLQILDDVCNEGSHYDTVECGWDNYTCCDLDNGFHCGISFSNMVSVILENPSFYPLAEQMDVDQTLNTSFIRLFNNSTCLSQIQGIRSRIEVRKEDGNSCEESSLDIRKEDLISPCIYRYQFETRIAFENEEDLHNMRDIDQVKEEMRTCINNDIKNGTLDEDLIQKQESFFGGTIMFRVLSVGNFRFEKTSFGIANKYGYMATQLANNEGKSLEVIEKAFKLLANNITIDTSLTPLLTNVTLGSWIGDDIKNFNDGEYFYFYHNSFIPCILVLCLTKLFVFRASM